MYVYESDDRTQDVVKEAKTKGLYFIIIVSIIDLDKTRKNMKVLQEGRHV
jgi:hypothetical protein